MLGLLQDFEITVGQALAIVICSRELDSFLQGELAGRGDLKAEAVKKALVEDLTGELQKQKGWGRSKIHIKKIFELFEVLCNAQGKCSRLGGLVAAARRLYDPT